MKWVSSHIVLLVCAIGVTLTGIGIAVAVAWPSDWSAMLGSFLVGLVATLVGVFVAVLAAIFIVERYADKVRVEAERAAALEKERYEGMWEAYLSGGVAALSAVLTHLSLFVAFGKSRYLELVKDKEDSRDASSVPETAGKFVPWLIESLDDGIEERRAGRSGLAGGGSRRMGLDDADRLVQALREKSRLNCVWNEGDLAVLLRYLGATKGLLNDEISLFQPFLARRMGLGRGLVRLSRAVANCVGVLQTCGVVCESGGGGMGEKTAASQRVCEEFCDLGVSAVIVGKFLLSGEDDLWQLRTAEGGRRPVPVVRQGTSVGG